MSYANDFVDIFLPALNYWVIWLIFLILIILVLILYAYPYIKKPKKEIHSYHIGIPITSIISLYIFTKMLEGVIYQGTILKVDSWFNAIIYPAWLDKVALFITNFGGTIIIVLLFTLALIALLYKKRWRYALFSTIAILGAEILVTIIKQLVQRTRPINEIVTGFSFPSGHAITAIIFVSLLIYSFKDDFKNKITRYVLITIFSAFFLAVAISRIILHVHWFSDVIAGISLSLFWFMCVILIERSIPGVVKAVKVETKEAKAIVPDATKK